MLRCMYSAQSGLKAFQQKMDVTANNIANVSTNGFKKSSLHFSDMMTQTMQSSASPSGGLGGRNGIAIGLGTKVASQSTLFTQGALMTTGSSTDLAIQGDGFFVVSNGNEIFYTRNGNFGVDVDGNLVTSEGYKVLGSTGNGTLLEPLKVPLGETMKPTQTSSLVIGNNLNSSTEVGKTHTTSIEVFDRLGNSHVIKIDFTKEDTNEWEYSVSLDPASDMIKSWLNDNAPDFDGMADAEKKEKLKEANDALLTDRTGKIIFDASGSVDATETQNANGGNGNSLTLPFSFSVPGTDDISISLDFSSMTQLSANTTAAAKSQDGNPAGVIKSISFDSNGSLLGVFSGGSTMDLGKLTMATFTNNEGLEAMGGTMYKKGNNSGEPMYSAAGGDNTGTLAVGYLEASNVDLSEEVTSIITCQRSYMMQSKMITVSDEMLQELINMKR